mmetsp:Transcript_5491/g.10602  ORF Transcript_5491/g.10602 Transcript_5491/m.10602 type:complete len:339 (+) Transcript_5491:1-1017(+)
MTDDDVGVYATDDAETNTFRLFVARSLGYLVGFGSLMLYTPIAVRVSRQKHADGLVMSTWWLKLSSYLLSDAYYVRKKYDLSTYAETVIITIESVVILGLVAFYQKRTEEISFWIMLSALVLASLYAFTIAPNDLIALGQLSSMFVNTAALVPQFHHNFVTKTKGDYSPLTATLAWCGCLVRIFTTITLNNSDPVLMVTFFSAFCANFTLLLQILYYGTRIEGLSFSQVFMADVVAADAAAAATTTTHSYHHEHGSDYDAALEVTELTSSAATSLSIGNAGVSGKLYGSRGERINEPGNTDNSNTNNSDRYSTVGTYGLTVNAVDRFDSVAKTREKRK